MPLNALERVVLARAVTDNAYRAASKSIIPGEYPIDMFFRVSGTLTRGEDYDTPVVNKLPLETLVLVLLSKLANQVQKPVYELALECLIEVNGVIQRDEDKEDEAREGVKAEVTRAWERIKDRTLTRANGKITCSLLAVNIPPPEAVRH